MKTNQPAPWEAGHNLQRATIEDGDEWRHTVYGGLYSLDPLHKLLARIFSENLFDVDERTPRGNSALFWVQVTQSGRLMLDTFTLSSAAWAAGRAVNPGPDSIGWLDGFEDAETEIYDEMAARFSAYNDDAEAETLQMLGVLVSRPITGQLLADLVTWIAARLGIEETLAPSEIRVDCYTVSRSKALEARPAFLNSFFATDLQRASTAVESGQYGGALATYLSTDSPQHHMDVRDAENTDELVRMLAPEHMPLGRWPEEAHKSLALSQQLAINQITGNFSEQEGVFGINGPPGTGKTTMLRDLVADIVTQRALQLADLSSPADAFESHTTGWNTGRRKTSFCPIKSHLTGFEIIVASYNNAAVENVTNEMPARGQIAEQWKDSDYLRQHGTRVLGKDAWGLIAATLGKKAKRNQFATKLWYKPKFTDNETEAELGLSDWLKEKHVTASPHLWQESVATFRQALAAEQKIRETRQTAHTALLNLPSLHADVNQLRDRLHRAKEVLDQLVAEEKQARQSANEAVEQTGQARRLRQDFLSAKPGFWENLFTFGKAARRWITEDEVLKSNVSDAEQFELTWVEELHRCTENVERNRATVHNLQREQEFAIAAVRSANAAIELVRAESDAVLPDAEWRRGGDKRELAAPWLDATWNVARTEVFLAALELQQAFLISGGEKLWNILSVAIDVAQGKAPSDAPVDAVRAAWQALFFVVPVISTTFASVNQMFEQVGAESFGWLLIDEAGQAPPQAAVGAIWRSKRVVAVGDPLQIEPVVTILHSTQGRLADHHGVSDSWMPSRQSVQTLSDRVTPIGTWLTKQGDEKIWVGAPLRVHRRCDNPMFSVVNNAVYGGLMVHGNKDRKDPLNERLNPVPPSCWIDVSSSDSVGHWIPAEGTKVESLLNKLMKEYQLPESQVLLLSPFRAVAEQLQTITRKGGFTEKLLVGTVHVAQGRQANVVVLVLGGNPERPDSRRWVAEAPNLLNVAVSRAEHRLYVIGDLQAWRSLPYFDTLTRQFKDWTTQHERDA